MISVAKQWNPKQALLKNIILKMERFNQTLRLCLDMHAFLHDSRVTHSNVKTIMDELWDNLTDEQFRYMPPKKDVSIAWNIYHITRIEDLVTNILITSSTQVFNQGQWMKKMGINITDTGNAMNRKEIEDFTCNINMEALYNYRMETGKKTQKVLSRLKPVDMRMRMEPSRIKRIMDEGGVLPVENSQWLLDFWGRKTIAGLLLMPITRHQVVHLNDALKLKGKVKKVKSTRNPQ
ncbi:MAG: DinB family protein [Spirochaetales bacterium]|nr:DinB family protein [Spirochaetales bacterium]